MGLPVIRLTLYGITGQPEATFDVKPGEEFDVKYRPVFTVTRIVVEQVETQEQLDV